MRIEPASAKFILSEGCGTDFVFLTFVSGAGNHRRWRYCAGISRGRNNLPLFEERRSETARALSFPVLSHRIARHQQHSARHAAAAVAAIERQETRAPIAVKTLPMAFRLLYRLFNKRAKHWGQREGLERAIARPPWADSGGCRTSLILAEKVMWRPEDEVGADSVVFLSQENRPIHQADDESQRWLTCSTTCTALL